MLYIPSNAIWKKNATTVAGGHGGGGGGLHQLKRPHGLCLDDRDGTLFIADRDNNRIVAWKPGDQMGRLVASAQQNQLNQLNWPTDVLVDKENDSLIICSRGNRRVMRWSLRSSTSQGECIIDNIDCGGLAMDTDGHLYVTDTSSHEVRRYEKGDMTKSIRVARGNARGKRLNQLNGPINIFIDDEGSVYVSDKDNHRVMKWVRGATEGIVVAGGRDAGTNLTQLAAPHGIYVDVEGTVYVTKFTNGRVTRWRKGIEKGEIIAGGNGYGAEAYQLHWPMVMSFDQHGHLYIADMENHRVQRFDIL